MASSTTTTTTTTLLATEDPSSSLARLDHQLSSLKISPTSYDLSDSSTLCNRSRSRHAASGSRFSLPRSFNRTHNAVRHFASSTSLFQSTGPFSGSVNPQLIHHKSDQQGQRPSLDHLSFLLPQEHTIRTRSLPTNHHFDPLSIEAIPDSGIGSSLDSNDDRSSITSGPG